MLFMGFRCISQDYTVLYKERSRALHQYSISEIARLCGKHLCKSLDAIMLSRLADKVKPALNANHDFL